MPALTADLVLAYCRTDYCVESLDGEHRLRVGRSHPDFDSLLARHGIDEWAVVTASNPRSDTLAPETNAARHRELLAAARPLTPNLWPARGVGADPAWAPEESLFLGGISAEAARDLAARFNQHALVAGSRGGRAELVFTGGTPILPALDQAVQRGGEDVRAAVRRARLQLRGIDDEPDGG